MGYWPTTHLYQVYEYLVIVNLLLAQYEERKDILPKNVKKSKKQPLEPRKED